MATTVITTATTREPGDGTGKDDPLPDAGRRPVQDPLTAVLEALDAAGLAHCRLRGPSVDGAGQRELDLLVDPRHTRRLARVVADRGFVRRMAWGRGGRLVFVTFDGTAGEWLKLDAVTTLRYGGKGRPLASRALRGALTRRARVGRTWELDPPDAILGLLLHGVLDKRSFAGPRRAEIEELRRLIQKDADLTARTSARFRQALGSALPWQAACEMIGAGNWERLLGERRRIAWVMCRRDPAGCARRWLEESLLGLARRIRRPLALGGYSVALLGPDGAGKTTLARTLAADPQLRARVVYMGTNVGTATVELPGAAWIRRRERGRRFGRFGGGVLYLLRLLEQSYRTLVALGWRWRGRLVVFDRHPDELRIAPPARGAGPRLRRWLLARASVPPDLVLVLDAPSPVLRHRKPEHELARLDRHRERYRSLPRMGSSIQLVEASGDEREVARRVKHIIWSEYVGRSRRSGHAAAGVRSSPVPAAPNSIEDRGSSHHESPA